MEFMAVIGLVLIVGGFTFLYWKRRRVMEYHDIDTPHVHPNRHGGGGGT